jgi:hypothetical protein
MKDVLVTHTSHGYLRFYSVFYGIQIGYIFVGFKCIILRCDSTGFCF